MFKGITTRLLVLFFLISLLPLLALSVIYVTKFKDVLQANALTYLDAQANKKILEISTYVGNNMLKVEKLATYEKVQNYLQEPKERTPQKDKQLYSQLEVYIGKKD